MKDSKPIKKKMKIFAREFGLEIKQLAAEIGVDYNTLVAINLGRRGVGPTVIRAIDKYLSKIRPGLKLNVFFFFEENAQPFLHAPVLKGVAPAKEKPAPVRSESPKESINKKIVEIRNRSGLTQKEFAALLKCSIAKIQAIEYNRAAPDIDFLKDLKRVGLIKSYDEIIDGVASTLDNKYLYEQKISEMQNRITSLEEDVEMYKDIVKLKMKQKAT